jgi:hypothetical protein
MMSFEFLTAVMYYVPYYSNREEEGKIGKHRLGHIS